VTNKTDFWIWWSNLLDLYAVGYNSSQITIWYTVIFFRLDIPLELFWLPTELNSTTPLYSLILLKFSWPCLFIIPQHEPRGKHRLLLSRMSVFGPLPSNWCPSIVECVTWAIFLSSRCLAMGTCVTIFFYHKETYNSRSRTSPPMVLMGLIFSQFIGHITVCSKNIRPMCLRCFISGFNSSITFVHFRSNKFLHQLQI
jgi:hypothetical protein